MSTKRTCITCTAKGINTNKIPLWTKKDGLYSMLPKVLTCEDKYNPQKQSLKKEAPEITGTHLELDLQIKETNQWVFYWAAEAGNQLDPEIPIDPAGSYGDESNRGVAKTNEEGNASLVLNCPKLYKEDDKLYPRHVHYTVLTKDNVWNETIGTLEIICKIPYDVMKDVVESGNHIIINALSEESFAKKHIPTSILCHHGNLEGLSSKKKEEVIKRLLQDNLSSFRLAKKFVDSVKDIKEVPIITYCANDECEASTKLIEHLYDAGFYNVIEYPGGTDEWFSERKVNFFDSDEEDAKEEGEKEEDEKDDVTKEEDTKASMTLDDEGSDDNDEEEILVYDGVQYIHRFDSNEVLLVDDLDVVGHYDGEDVEWLSTKKWREHKKRVDALSTPKKHKMKEDDVKEGDVKEDDVKEDDVKEDDVKEDDVKEDDVKVEPIGKQESSSSSESSDDEYDYNESSLKSRKVVDLKGLLDKLNLNKQGKKKELITRLIENKPQTGGGDLSDGLLYGGGVTQNVLNQQFRGWGFTFLR